MELSEEVYNKAALAEADERNAKATETDEDDDSADCLPPWGE